MRVIEEEADFGEAVILSVSFTKKVKKKNFRRENWPREELGSGSESTAKTKITVSFRASIVPRKRVSNFWGNFREKVCLFFRVPKT